MTNPRKLTYLVISILVTVLVVFALMALIPTLNSMFLSLTAVQLSKSRISPPAAIRQMQA